MAFPSLLLVLLVSMLLYVVLLLSKRYWRLRHINGPFLAAFTDLWRFRLQYSGSIQPILHQLHKRYGPVVRIGPNTISVSEPAYITAIYGAMAGFTKSDSYGGMRTYINGHSIGSVIDIQDEKKVKAIKRAIETVFLANNLIEYEPQVDATIEKLMESLKRRGHATSFNLYEMVQHFQLDFLLLIAFGEDAGCLRQGKDVLGLTGLTHRRLQHWYSWQPVPSLERFIFQNPLWSGRFVQKSRWAREGASRVEARRRLLASHELPPSSKPTTEASRATDLIDKYFQASHKYPDAIPPKLLSNLVNSTIAAGTDTTIGSITIILYFLLKHPSVLAKLLAELNQADISFSSSFPIPYSAVKSLPYLDAVIKESLRLLAVLGTILERTVPPQGSTLIGPGMAHHLPGGTVVGCSPYVVHRHEPTFGPDADRFVPERWTTWASSTSTSSSPAQKLAMDQANLSWSHGARTCLGKNLALIEMKKLIPTLLLKVEFQLCDPSLDLKIERGILDSDEFSYHGNSEVEGVMDMYVDGSVGYKFSMRAK